VQEIGSVRIRDTIMQPYSNVEGLDDPWRIAGKSPLSKNKESGVWCPWAITAEKKKKTKNSCSGKLECGHVGELFVPSGPPAYWIC
jgi:hypothetical protein